MSSDQRLDSSAIAGRARTLACVLVLALGSTAGDLAQAQVLMQPNISVAQARLIVDTIIAQCSASEDLVTVTIAVVDRAGIPVIQVRADTASPHNWELAYRKAYTARTFRRTSISWRDRTAGDSPLIGQRELSNTVPLGGGAPIMMGDVPVGGVGVSGSSGGQEGDTACAEAGIAAIADQLE
ncbi:MAG: heme-binding protein [Gammaproteobacteria bacterium]|nr:heme-binding protein [Gammaproteobacteria bacterium]MDH3507765.1 heme-binding protein [Gammaproteobacteria bacterium]